MKKKPVCSGLHAVQLIESRPIPKDVILDFYNEAGQLAISYKIYRCWVSEY